MHCYSIATIDDFGQSRLRIRSTFSNEGALGCGQRCIGPIASSREEPALVITVSRTGAGVGDPRCFTSMYDVHGCLSVSLFRSQNDNISDTPNIDTENVKFI